MRTFNLISVDSRKALSNQHVNEYECQGEIFSDLISYTTRVASYNHTTAQMSVYSCQSKTTARHINAFLVFYGFDTCTMKELQDY